jgi:hypothetical protein
MVTAPKQTFNQTPFKVRTLWDIAVQLIADYENFHKQLSLLEAEADSLSTQIQAIITNNSNV